MAILRRSYKDENPLVCLHYSQIDFSRAEIIKNDEHIPLTAKEHNLLSALYRNAGRIVAIDALCEAAWGDNPFGYENSLMAHIRRIREKIEKIAAEIYGAASVTYVGTAESQIARLETLGFGNLPICMAKTQYSFSDTPTLLGAPENFRVNISNVKVSAGAGFVVVYTGDIMTMPGLPKVPSAEKIDVDNDGKISGLF